MNKIEILGILSMVNQVTNVVLENIDESDSSDDDSEELINLITILKDDNNSNNKKITKVAPYVETTTINYTEEQFQQYFRLSRKAFECLVEKTGPELRRKSEIGRQTISIEKQLLATIWLLTTPDSYRSVADRFDMGKSSLSASFFRVVEALNKISTDIIKWPSGNQLDSIKESFKSLGGIDNVIGVIDGTFIPIKAPKEDPEMYITKKCNYAITLQAVCDSNLKFTDIFVGYPGSVSDTTIFHNSDLYFQVEDNITDFFPNHEFIIGDKEYPILPWCIPPYIDKLTPAQKNFNENHSKTRQTIERSFALLFGRFRRLKYLDMNRHDCIPTTVLAACVLHNICLSYEELFVDQYIQDGRVNVLSNEGMSVTMQRHDINLAKMKRDNICNNLYN